MRDINFTVLEGRVIRAPEASKVYPGERLIHFTIANNQPREEEGKYPISLNSTNVEIEAKGNVGKQCIEELKGGEKIRVTGEIAQDRGGENFSEREARLFIRAVRVEFSSPVSTENQATVVEEE